MKVYDNGFDRRGREKKKMQGFRPKPAAPKRWSHQDLLDSLKGHKVEYRLLDENASVGVVLEADQFTILVSTDGTPENAVCVYKSALTYFKKA